MITRSDYMAKRATHAEFYRAVNATAGYSLRAEYTYTNFFRSVVTVRNIVERARAALANGDEHLNSIPLPIWDGIASAHKAEIGRALRAHGDFYSLAGGVCCVKQAAKDAADTGRLPVFITERGTF